MKLIILFLIFISCTIPEQDLKYIPKEVTANDTLTKLINNERQNRNLNPLQSETLLISLSKIKAIQMESQNQLNHNGFTNLETHTETFGQIVGYGYNNEISLFNAYMYSPNHRQDILGSYTHIGSYTVNGYNCVIFAKY